MASTMKLFLGGGGGGEDSRGLDKKFVASLDLSKPLLYIPIATNTDKYPYSGCVAWLSSVLGPFGVKNIVMWTEEDLKNKTKEDFEQFCGIYIGGGNTYKLLKEFKEFGTFQILKECAEGGMPIYGGSAGAIILARTIIPAGFLDENKVGLIDLSALNLVQGYDVWCHYAGTENDAIKKYMNQFGLKKVIAIPENAGVIVNNNEIESVGPGKVVFFDSKTLWFKRKCYGWGWTPVTWQGWLIVFVYVGLVFLFTFTIDQYSSIKEIFFTFMLPVALLTTTLLRICYKTGEKPRWQWGNSKKNGSR